MIRLCNSFAFLVLEKLFAKIVVFLPKLKLTKLGIVADEGLSRIPEYLSFLIVVTVSKSFGRI